MRRGENLIVTLAVPLGILVFFSKVDTTIPTDFKHPVDFLVPGVLSLAVMAAAMVSLGIATGFERRYGVLKRLGSTPLSRGGLLAAKTATVLLFELVEAVLVVVTGIALGWHVPRGLVAALGLLLDRDGRVRRDRAADGRHAARRGESRGRERAVPRAACSSAGWRTRSPSSQARSRRSRRRCPRPRCSDTVRSVLSTQAFPTGQLVVLVAWAVLAPLAAARWFRWEE